MRFPTALRALTGVSLALTLSCGIAAPAFADDAEELQQAQEEIDAQAEAAKEAEELALSLSGNASEGELTEVHDMLNQMISSAADARLSALAERGGSQNYQLMFAQLQASLAEEARKDALEAIEAIQQDQEESAAVAERINTCRKAADGLAGSEEEERKILGELTEFCNERGIDMPETTSSGILDEDGWNSLELSLEKYRETIGQSVEKTLPSFQDYVSQCNEHLASASTAISDANVSSSSQGVRGTMLGSEGGVGMLATGGLIGLAVGVVGTLGVVRSSEKKRAKAEAERPRA